MSSVRPPTDQVGRSEQGQYTETAPRSGSQGQRYTSVR